MGIFRIAELYNMNGMHGQLCNLYGQYIQMRVGIVKGDKKKLVFSNHLWLWAAFGNVRTNIFSEINGIGQLRNM